jgi:hypothetical protein
MELLGGQWLTYRDAAALLGKSVEATRQQASRSRWATRKNVLGVTEVNVPVTPPSDEPVTAVTSRAVTVSERGVTIDMAGSMVAGLRSDLDAANQRIGSLTEQLRTARRELRRVEAQRDGLNVALAKLAGTWPKEDSDARP